MSYIISVPRIQFPMRSGFWGGFVLILLLLVFHEVEICSAQSAGGFITWDDLMMVSSSTSVEGNADEEESVRLIIVDPKGHGDSVTVNAAIDMVPVNNPQRVKIHLLPGVYREKVYIPATKPYISLIGDPKDPSGTVITGHDKASDPDGKSGQLGTFNSATIAVEADYFCAAGITFENTVVVPPGGAKGYQAVAMRVSGDKSVFYKVRFIGSQDTLLDLQGSHYFYKCFIQGATDFIFGNARSLYQECTMRVVSPAYAIAAQHRAVVNENTGFSFVNCTVTGEGTPYLGRAWGDYSRIIYSLCKFDINVMFGGWQDWGIQSRRSTVVFGEYQCTGRGADKTGRVPWSRALSYADARPFLDMTFISGEQWLRL